MMKWFRKRKVTADEFYTGDWVVRLLEEQRQLRKHNRDRDRADALRRLYQKRVNGRDE